MLIMLWLLFDKHSRIQKKKKAIEEYIISFISPCGGVRLYHWAIVAHPGSAPISGVYVCRMYMLCASLCGTQSLTFVSE